MTFLLGGTVLPVVHRVHHGYQLAAHYGLDCDHTHGGWHPDFEFLDEEDCLLCQRDLDVSQVMLASTAVFHGEAGASKAPAGTVALVRHSPKSIRGPPVVMSAHTVRLQFMAAAGAPATLLYA